MNKKLIVFVVVVFVAVMIGIVWYRGRSTSQPPKYTGPVEKIVIANQGLYSIFNLKAQDKGFFKKNGLDSEVKEYQS